MDMLAEEPDPQDSLRASGERVLTKEAEAMASAESCNSFGMCRGTRNTSTEESLTVLATWIGMKRALPWSQP